MIIINLVLTVIVMFVVAKRLSNPGMTSNLKNQIRSRYLEFVAIFILLSFPILYVTRPEYKYTIENSTITGGTNYVTGYMTIFCGAGVFMAITRLRDPLIARKCFNIWMQITCRKEKIDNDFGDTIKNTNLNAFLRSSLNTEIVISILMGITILAACSSDIPDLIRDSDML